MTTETSNARDVHTCSYACDRPQCIRAQRDELASRLAAAPPPAADCPDCLNDGCHCNSCRPYPPPAAARGDVRGLVGYDAGLLNDFGGGDVNWWQDYLRAEIERANEFWREHTEQALAAEGVQCETCNGRGEVGGPVGQTAESFGYETFPCPDCAEGVQAGEVEQRARDLLAAELRADMRPGAAEEAESGKLDHDSAMRAIVAALSQQQGQAVACGGCGNADPEKVCIGCLHPFAAPPSAPVEQYTYTSTQATKCAGCGEHKHTPLRIDAMGGYVCLTCIDQKLGSLLGEFGYPPSAPVLTLTGYQLRAALNFLAPDRDDEQMATEVAIQWGPAREDEEGRDEAGLFCWCVECPEEGSVRLDEKPIAGRDGLQYEPSAPVGVEGPLSVFSAGEWRYSETGQTFSAKDLDEAAFVVYRDHLAQQPSAGVTHADHVRGLADMLAPEKQADTLRAAADAMPDQQPAAVDEATIPAWRVMPFTGSWKACDERWEVYSPDGSGGVVLASEVRSRVVADLLDALATQHQEPTT